MEGKKICVIGSLGLVGLVTATGLAELGNEVIGVDLNQKGIKDLEGGILPFYEPQLDELVIKNFKIKRLAFTTDLATAVNLSQILFITVGTPAKTDGEADLSQVERVAQDLSKSMEEYKIIVVKSTAPPEALELVTNILESSEKVKGRDFDLVVNPEFLRGGNAVYDFFHPDRIIVGADKQESGEMVADLFKPLKAPIILTSPVNAQLIKYAANAFLTARISFINEIASICEKVGVDIEEVAKGMGFDKRIGHSYLRAGIGFGGPCLGKDLKALIQVANKYGYEAPFLKAILDRNQEQVKNIISKTKESLGGKLQNKTIAVLGLAFKPNTNNTKESVAIEIIKQLQFEGAKIKAYDPRALEDAQEVLERVEFCSNPYEAATDSDALLILTAWQEFKELDLQKIKTVMKTAAIMDGVNILDLEQVKAIDFKYAGVGR